MSRVKGRDTGLERIVRSELHKRGYRFGKHVKGLPGKPDIVFVSMRVAVFLDGDFWHGYRFPLWKDGLSEFWQRKIGETRVRDQKNFAKLRHMGWRVIRVWEHSVERDFDGVIERICKAVGD
jgi:DNA mismatch endonuclease (patch repair protein)